MPFFCLFFLEGGAGIISDLVGESQDVVLFYLFLFMGIEHVFGKKQSPL